MSDVKNKLQLYMQPAFLICVFVLAVSAAGMSLAIKTFGVYLEKEPLPLKKSLELLDEAELGHYKVSTKEKIDNAEILKSLGTEDYIQWIMEDVEVPVDSPVRYCMLFITYYERPDRVPHVPEECYTGGGNQKLISDNVLFEFDWDNSRQMIPARYLVFSRAVSGSWFDDVKFPVMYLFNVNGNYANSREQARITLNKNLFRKSSYFSKVEWKFFNNKFGVSVYPDKEQAVTAGRKLLDVILPVLQRHHWPDW